MSCTVEDFDRIAQEMRHLGCDLLKNEHNTLSIASGDVTVNIHLSKHVEFSRITEIQCRLNEVDNSKIKLGNLTIVNQNMESVWNFENLNKIIFKKK